MIDIIINKIKEEPDNWEKYKSFFVERKIEPKTILLNAGEIAKYIHFIKAGCVREWFNKDGKDITFQFFMEGQPVASIDSLLNNIPSLFSIESIESSLIISVKKHDFETLFTVYPELKSAFDTFIFQRFRNYSQLFLSRITDTPKERYDDLIHNHPEIIKRVPQHYIASFLGITPVSLSRIRNKK